MIGVMSSICSNLSSEQVIDLAKKCSLGGVEWSANAHVPAGRLLIAEHVHKGMEKAGLKVLSYGSNYRLRESDFPKDAFMPVVMCADILHAPTIRVWAGSLPSQKAHHDYYHRAASELRAICKMAALFNITVSLQYHSNTLSQDCQSAINLLRLANCDNLKIDWQPNPKMSKQKNVEDLQSVLPHLASVHVLHLSDQGERLLLAEGNSEWKEYVQIAKDSEANFIVEFAKDDAPEIVAQDVAVLQGLMGA